MLRSLIRGPRTVKVPVENGAVGIQKVEVKQKAKYVLCKGADEVDANHCSPLIVRILFRVALTYCVVETIFWLRSDDFKQRVGLFKQRQKESKHQPSRRAQAVNGQAKNTTPQPSRSNAAESQTEGKAHILQLTIPVWFRERKREMLKESTPQWIAFRELQQDKKRMTDVKMKVSKIVAAQLRRAEHSGNLEYIQFNNNIGANFEFIPPIWSPQTYEVPTVWIGTDYKVNGGWRPLSAAASARTERMFHPIIFAQAFYAGIEAFSRTSFKITKGKVLDIYYGPEPMRIRVSMVGKGSQKTVTDVVLEKELSHEQKVLTELPMNQVPEKQAKLSLPFLRGDSETDSVVKKHYRGMIASTTYQDAIEHASAVFKQTWLDKQVAAVQETTAGACAVKGVIDCMGARGKYRLEVEAFYLPEQDDFVGKPRITTYYIIPDFSKWDTRDGAAQKRVVKRQPESQGMPDKHPPVHEPPTSEEKPSPGKDAGK